MEIELLYRRRKFNKKLSIVRLDVMKTMRRVSVRRIQLKRNSPLAIEDSGANNFIEQLQNFDCIDTTNSSNPNYFIFPDGVPLYRRVNELSVWQNSGPVALNSIEYYKRSVRLARANLVSLMSGAMGMLEERVPGTTGKLLRKIASTAERLASGTLGDFDRLCRNTDTEVDGVCSGEVGNEWERIQQMLTEVYFQFDTIELQSQNGWK